MTVRRTVIFVVCVLTAPIAAFAQESHWGIVAAVTPEWKVPSQLEKLFDGTVDLKGTDFSIGIARGRALSGDWGVSFIHKQIKDGSKVEKFEQQCGFSNGCIQKGDSITTSGVTVNGLEVHKFVPFGTIRERVQIGMNFAGGFGKFQGTLQKRSLSAEPVGPPFTNPPAGKQVETNSTEDARELIGISTLPLLKIQAAVAVIVAPAFKIRVQGGIDVPGYEVFSLVGVVFLGAK